MSIVNDVIKIEDSEAVDCDVVDSRWRLLINLSCISSTRSTSHTISRLSSTFGRRRQIKVLFIRRRTVPVRTVVPEQQRVTSTASPTDFQHRCIGRPVVHHVVLPVRILAAYHHAVSWRRDVWKVSRVAVRYFCRLSICSQS